MLIEVWYDNNLFFDKCENIIFHQILNILLTASSNSAQKIFTRR